MSGNNLQSPSSAKRILLVAGVRPNFIKLAPLYDALCSRPEAYEPVVVHTGQHYDKNMSDIFFEQLQLPKPDAHLGVGSGTHGLQTGKVLIEIEKFMLEQRPDMVIVFGDVNSTMAAAIAAVKLRIPVAHVEAGLRSNDWSMPEEINRMVADRVSTLHFTTCEDANINLLREGVGEDSIHFVGNIMIDSLRRFISKADSLTVLGDLDVEPGKYTLVTIHRPGNVDERDQLRRVVSMLEGLATHAPVVFPVHPRTRKNLIEFESIDNEARISGNPRIRLVEPLGYLEFLKLEKEAGVIITDSGGVQEETTCLGVPCLTVRPNTERPVTITEGTNILLGLNPKRVIAFAKEYLNGNLPEKRRPLLWDGKTAGRIIDVLDRFFGGRDLSVSPETVAVARKEVVRSSS
jgi:UDP-N-acetylglucosamine 2-epimerase (non-hydrolysing)